MARRTKTEAEQTRNALLDAAEKVFYKFGVSRTTLEQIASAAQMTRGAVYWHFRDKIQLCDAMANRVFLPQEEVLEKLANSSTQTPLEDLQRACTESLVSMATDKRRQRVVSIMLLRCEYVDGMEVILKRRRACKDGMLARFERLFAQAHKQGMLQPHWPPQLAAVTLLALMSGLITRNLENPKTFALGKIGADCLDAFFKSVRV